MTKLKVVLLFTLLMLGIASPAFAQEDLGVFEIAKDLGATWNCVPVHEDGAPDDGYYAIFKGVTKAELSSLVAEGGYANPEWIGRLDEVATVRVDYCPPPPPPLFSFDRNKWHWPQRPEISWNFSFAPIAIAVGILAVICTLGLALIGQRGWALAALVIALAALGMCLF